MACGDLTLLSCEGTTALVRVHSLDLCGQYRLFLPVPVHLLDLYKHSKYTQTVVNQGTVVRRRNSAFSEREREEMGVPTGMTVSV